MHFEQLIQQIKELEIGDELIQNIGEKDSHVLLRALNTALADLNSNFLVIIEKLVLQVRRQT